MFPRISHTRTLLAHAGLSPLLLFFLLPGPSSSSSWAVGLCKMEEFWHISMTGFLLGSGGKEKFNFEIPKNQVLSLFPSSLSQISMGKGERGGWYLKAPAAIFLSLLKQPVSFSNSPTLNLRRQIRSTARPRVARACKQ